MLEYYDAVEDMEYVGGMAELKAWLHTRSPAFSERARRFGLPKPRGLLLLGVQGGGQVDCWPVEVAPAALGYGQSVQRDGGLFGAEYSCCLAPGRIRISMCVVAG